MSFVLFFCKIQLFGLLADKIKFAMCTFSIVYFRDFDKSQNLRF